MILARAPLETHWQMMDALYVGSMWNRRTAPGREIREGREYVKEP